uniref:Uncharacterized protein n=1 Tax=Davidia involucrata TaxID=16924 RepID=A0A5B6ZV77_DAVIN
MQVIEVRNTCQNGSRQNEAAEHVRSSMIPNHMLFGLNIPQKCATQSSNIEMHSQCPDTLRKGKMIGGLDMNFLNLSATNLEKQNRNFDSESLKRMSAKYPFVCKHRGTGLNTKGMGSLDLYPNETIPAMQLLSLMDAGMQSSTPFSLDGKSKFFDKPFFPCDHHPKVSVDVKSKFLEKPFLPHDHHSKEFCILGTGVYKASDGSRHPSSAFYGKNHPSEESCECSPAIPAVGAFPSLFKKDGSFKRAAGFTDRVSSKLREREKAKRSFSPTQNRGCRPQKSVCRSGVSGTSRASNPVQDKQKGFLGASDSVRFPLQCRTIEDSTKHIDLEARGVNGTIWSMKSISKIDICSVNRNPADFSIPEAGNKYMISGEHLKFGKKIASKDRSGLINVDGRKRQRVTKPTSMKEQAQHVS